MPATIVRTLKLVYLLVRCDKELDILAELFLTEKEKQNEKLLDLSFTCNEYEAFQADERLGHLDRKLQKFEQGGKSDDADSIVIRSLRTLEERSERIKMEIWKTGSIECSTSPVSGRSGYLTMSFK